MSVMMSVFFRKIHSGNNLSRSVNILAGTVRNKVLPAPEAAAYVPHTTKAPMPLPPHYYQPQAPITTTTPKESNHNHNTQGGRGNHFSLPLLKTSCPINLAPPPSTQEALPSLQGSLTCDLVHWPVKAII
eukprot:28909-Amphidinium_carterae.1